MLNLKVDYSLIIECDKVFNYRYYNFIQTNLSLSNSLISEITIFLSDTFIKKNVRALNSDLRIELLLFRSIVFNIKFSPVFKNELDQYGFKVNRDVFILNLQNETFFYDLIGINPKKYSNIVKKLLIFLRTREYIERLVSHKNNYPLQFTTHNSKYYTQIQIKLNNVVGNQTLFDNVMYSPYPFTLQNHKKIPYLESNSFRSFTRIMHHKLCNKPNSYSLLHILKLSQLPILYKLTQANSIQLSNILTNKYGNLGLKIPCGGIYQTSYDILLETVDKKINAINTAIRFYYAANEKHESAVKELGSVDDRTAPIELENISNIASEEVRLGAIGGTDEVLGRESIAQLLRNKSSVADVFSLLDVPTFDEDSRPDTGSYLRVLTLKDVSMLLGKRNNLRDLKSIVLQYILFRKALDLNKPLYFPHIVDFRGRFYPFSVIGLTGSKILRATASFPNSVCQTPKVEDSLFIQKMLKSGDNLNLGLGYSCTPIERYYLYIILFELGKTFKSKLINKGNYSKGLEDFINNGYKQLKVSDWDKNLNSDDRVYLLYLYEVYKGILSGEAFDESVLIFKDATASGLQNMGLLLGFNSPETLKLCNLSGDSWNDTYTFILSAFIKTFAKNHDINEFSHLINRAVLKKCIMTKFYNVSSYQSRIYYFKALEDANLWVDENKAKGRVIHANFIKFLDEFLSSLFFIENEVNLSTLFKKSYKTYDFNYYAVKTSYSRVTYAQITDKYSIYERTSTVDEAKTRRANNANITHFLDSQLAAYVVNEVDSCYTIHDQFITPLCNVHLVMDAINVFFDKRISNKPYSTTVII